MPIGDFVTRLLGWLQRQNPSKDTAKNRLQLILIQDRAGIDPTILDSLRDDLILLMSKYFDVSSEGIEVELQREGESTALVANIPIRAMKGRLGSDFYGSRDEDDTDHRREEAIAAAETLYESDLPQEDEESPNPDDLFTDEEAEYPADSDAEKDATETPDGSSVGSQDARERTHRTSTQKPRSS